MQFAARTLYVTTKAGDTREVQTRLYEPQQDGPSWICRYEIDWPEDGWPAETRRSQAGGADSMHALQLGLQKLGLDLHSTSYHREGKMWWQAGVVGYGFALPRDARDLLRGDDAKWYG